MEEQLSALNADTLGGKVAVTMGTLIDRRKREELLLLQHSTQTTNRSLIDLHILPKWRDARLSDMTALAVKTWLGSLPYGAASKA